MTTTKQFDICECNVFVNVCLDALANVDSMADF